jgi:hypothetical protein
VVSIGTDYTKPLFYAQVVFLQIKKDIKNVFPLEIMEGVSLIYRGQPKGVKPKTRDRKLRSVYWKGALKQTGVK